MPDFNRDGSFYSENPPSRRWRYIDGLCRFRTAYPGVSPKELVSRLKSGRNWPEMSALFSERDLTNWELFDHEDGWRLLRTSGSAAETVRRAGLTASPYNKNVAARYESAELSQDQEQMLEDAGW